MRSDCLETDLAIEEPAGVAFEGVWTSMPTSDDKAAAAFCVGDLIASYVACGVPTAAKLFHTSPPAVSVAADRGGDIARVL